MKMSESEMETKGDVESLDDYRIGSVRLFCETVLRAVLSRFHLGSSKMATALPED